ncbi:MAG: restriction endonuclease [Armatimonadota bacterium]|nr:MAG: restriction endonuclease [Armatimonadota bacterium]
MALPAQPTSQGKVKISYEEFLQQLDEDTLAEWVDGEVVFLSPARLEHQLIADFLTAVMGAFVSHQGTGQVISAPFQMRLLQTERGREPDILFVAKENLHRLRDTHLEGGADLVVEITSPESLIRDRGEKFAEYELEGIPEYWVIDPDAHRVDFFVLGEDGRYERRYEDSDGVYDSEVLKGFRIPVRWFWERPSLQDALRWLGVV